MKKVLHVFPEMGKGGTERVIYNISKYLNKTDDYKCFLCSTSGVMEGFLSTELEVVKIPYLNDKKLLVRNIKDLKNVVMSIKPNIIHTHSIYSLILIYLMKKIYRIDVPTIHTGHGGPRKNYDKIVSRFLFMVDVYIAISKESYLYLNKKNKNVMYIPNGIDQPRNDEVFNSEFINIKEGIQLGFVGRLTEQKGLDVLLKAVKILKQKDFPIHLTVVGDGDELNESIEFVEENNLNKSVTFMGFQKEPWSLLKEIPIIVMPSRWEPGGLVALEAMARNHTIIASKVNGLKDSIKHEINGYLFTVDNIEELVSIISDIYLNQKYILLSKEERDSFIFDNRCGEQMNQVYNELLRKKR